MYVKRIYRPFRQGRTNSMIHVRSIGHHVFRKGEEIYIRKLRKYFLELFWCVKGEGRFSLGKRHWTLKPGCVCFYFPGDTHDAVPVSEEWDYYWLTIDGDNLEDIIRCFHLKRTPVAAENCPTELFELAYETMLENSIQNEYLAGAYGFEILSRSVMGRRKRKSRLVEAFLNLVSENYSDGECGITEFCEILKTHRVTLFRKMKAECGITPSEYLISYRIQQATELIRQKEFPMSEIALQTGFSSLNYFTKVIRRTLGILPGEISSVYTAPVLDKIGSKCLSPPDLTGKNAVPPKETTPSS